MKKDLKTYRNRSRLFIAAAITSIVFVGLNSHLFISLGILNFSPEEPQKVELDALAQLGVNVDWLERDLNRMVANMSNAQQGNHFAFGIISGLIFSQPTAGLSVGLIKETIDFLNNFRDGNINSGYFIDTLVDIIFWALGGFVGFYLLTSTYELFHSNNIKSPKDLAAFLGKKVFRKNSMPPKKIKA